MKKQNLIHYPVLFFELGTECYQELKAVVYWQPLLSISSTNHRWHPHETIHDPSLYSTCRL